MKVSFPNAFDARAFCSSFEGARKTDNENLPKIRVRMSRSKEDQALFKKNIALVRKLNEESKVKTPNVSFSLRDNLSIWKFTKNDQGKWIRDAKWSSSDDTPGNNHGTPRS